MHGSGTCECKRVLALLPDWLRVPSLPAIRHMTILTTVAFHDPDGESPLSMLVVVPCGKSKIWDRQPDYGPAPALVAYTGTMCRLNRQYAETFGDRWIMLSPKYGFIEPDFVIPETYDISFRLPATNPISGEELQHQVRELGLDAFTDVTALGGSGYRGAITAAFAGTGARLHAPFAGLPIGKMMQATRAAVEHGRLGHT
jgi:hypothetical protein